jgi:hypothetical protein
LAKPGVLGLSSNSSEQMTQTLMGKSMTSSMIRLRGCASRSDRLVAS